MAIGQHKMRAVRYPHDFALALSANGRHLEIFFHWSGGFLSPLRVLADRKGPGEKGYFFFLGLGAGNSL